MVGYLRGGLYVEENVEITKVVNGKEKHFSDKKFLNKLQRYGLKLGFKTLYGAAILYSALKSDKIPQPTKLMIIGVLGYFILPTDFVADFLPMVGLADDALIILKAITMIYSSITDEIKEEAHQLLRKIVGEKYQSYIENENIMEYEM